MLKHLWILLLAGIFPPVAVASDQAAGTSEHACEYKIIYKNKRIWGTTAKTYGPGRYSGGTSIETRAGKIQKVAHWNRATNLAGLDGSSCHFDAFRDAERQRAVEMKAQGWSELPQKWQDKGNATTIEFSEDWGIGNTLTITHTKEGYLVDMSKLLPKYPCHRAIELPAWVFISKTSRQCEVRLFK